MPEPGRRRLLAAAALVPALLACAETGGGGPAPQEAGPGGAPSGPAIAFEREHEGNADLWVVSAEGGLEHRLTRHPAADILPRWTPDGAAILFSSLRDGHWQLYRTRLDGQGSERLRGNAFREWQADPHPDGTGFAFLSSEGGAEGLFAAPWSGGPPRLLVRHGEGVDLGNPDWSPEMRRLVYSSDRGVGGHRISLLDVGSGEERRLSPLAEGGCEPRLAPDGRGRRPDAR
jgi:Tol biopolymer transport system component